ncbi:MAG: MFS transporter, partial [Rhodospirillales bacterium]|nr:MFS transporter [Rhodospirillales bacterium]
MNFPLLSTLADRIRRQGVVQVMRHRDFARYVSTSWAAMIGLWAQRLAIGWMTWELTHSPAWLGAIALGNALPAVVLVPFAGAIADRVDRLWLLKFAQGFQFLVSAALALSTLAGLMDIWLLLSLSIAVGLLETLATPSRMTIGPGLVPREDLSGAIALTAVAFNSATFIGPAIAGLVISKWGIGYAFVLACIGLTPHFLILYAIRLRATEHVAGRGQSLLGDVMEALRYLAGHQSLAPILM